LTIVLSQLKRQQEKGLLPKDCSIEICKDKSAIENFLALNKLSKNSRKIAPMSPLEQQFMSFTERELMAFFWKRELLRTKLQDMVSPDYPGTAASRLSLADVTSWIGTKEPGFLIKRLLSDVAKEGLTIRQRGKAGHKAAVKLMSLKQIRQHIEPLRQPSFDPEGYGTKGYILRGSIRTDGFRIQLLAFKLKELQSVRYRRLPDNVLPPRITSIKGGTDYFLTEIRNIVKTKEDVAQLWPNCRPEDIKILGLDLGQACVLGASALLPETARLASDVKMKGYSDKDTDVAIKGSCIASTTATPTEASPHPATFYNLAVKQKAVYQPTFKHRCWMEEQKGVVPMGETDSISDIESNLPPLRGEGASYVSFIEGLEKVEQRLDGFYNGNNMRFKRHKWDARRARDAEYKTITNRLLTLVGGSIGCRRKETNKVVIAVGLGQFSSKARLSSLHESFMSYFVQKVIALPLICLLYLLLNLCMCLTRFITHCSRFIRPDPRGISSWE